MEYSQSYPTNNVYDVQLVMKARRHTMYSPKPQHTVWNKMSDGEIGKIQDWLERLVLATLNTTGKRETQKEGHYCSSLLNF